MARVSTIRDILSARGLSFEKPYVKSCAVLVRRPTRRKRCTEFIQGVESRLANRVQLTSDGLRLYLDAVVDAFGEGVDYAKLVKYYRNASDEGKSGTALLNAPARGPSRLHYATGGPSGA
jgi:hypothetical protein